MHFCRFSNIFLLAVLQMRRYAERLFPWSLVVFRGFTLTACGNERISSDFLKNAAEKYMLSGRKFNRILKMARTIADLEAKENIELKHLTLALQYRVDMN